MRLLFIEKLTCRESMTWFPDRNTYNVLMVINKIIYDKNQEKSWGMY